MLMTSFYELIGLMHKLLIILLPIFFFLLVYVCKKIREINQIFLTLNLILGLYIFNEEIVYRVTIDVVTLHFL